MITFTKLFQLIIKYDDNITPELEKYITEVNEVFVNISTEYVSQLIILIPYLKAIDTDIKINYKFNNFTIIDDDISKEIIKRRRKFLKLEEFSLKSVQYDKM